MVGGSVQARGPVQSSRGLPADFFSLDSVKAALVARELVGFDAHSLQDGDEEMGEGEFMIAGVALPTGVIRDSGIGLVVFVSLSELEVATVPEAQVPAAGGNDRVVPG